MKWFASSTKSFDTIKHTMSKSLINPPKPIQKTLTEKPRSFYHHYTLKESIGSGAFSTVKECVRIIDGIYVSIVFFIVSLEPLFFFF